MSQLQPIYGVDFHQLKIRMSQLQPICGVDFPHPKIRLSQLKPVWAVTFHKLKIGRHFNSDRESEVSHIYVRIHKLCDFSNFRKYVKSCNLRICDRAKLVKCTNKVGMGRFSNITQN